MDMEEWAEKHGFNDPCFCHINMTETSSNCTGGIVKVMLKNMASALGIDNIADKAVIEEEFKKKVFV